MRDNLNIDIRRLSLRALLERVVDRSDRRALDEFHSNRRVFDTGSEHGSLFIEFLERLRLREVERQNGHSRQPEELVDRAYSMTVYKFCRLPEDDQATQGTNGGIDCRHYFRAFLKRLNVSSEGMSEIEEEQAACHLLTSLARHHFQLSLMEAKRKDNPFVSRYEWRYGGNGKSAYFWFPRSFSGAARGRWLDENVSDYDPERPGERDRVQSLIDEHFGHEHFVEIDERLADHGAPTRRDHFLPWGVLHGIGSMGLDDFVSEEKAVRIDEQRPSIQALGARRLRDLVLAIFETIEEPEPHAGRLARRFGLSKAAFSRFAGSRWPRDGGAGRIPDLWRNVARVLSRHEAFTEAAKRAGVWLRVERIAQSAL